MIIYYNQKWQQQLLMKVFMIGSVFKTANLMAINGVVHLIVIIDQSSQKVGLVKCAKVQFIALNKEDRVSDKKSILPSIAYISKNWPIFESVFPICAKTGRGVNEMLEALEKHTPEKPHIFSSEQLTEHTEKFLCTELIREKTIRYLGDELPYSTTVVVEEFSEQKEITHIRATLWVERESQKAIVIGKEGAHLKRIATDARLEIEALLQRKIYLRLWVKTQKGWTNNIDCVEITSIGN